MDYMRPKFVRILGKRFSITWGGDLDEGLVGECDADKQRIVIRDGQPLESEQDTLLHEVLHAVDEAMDCKLKETQIKKLATGFLSVLKDDDNEELVARLQLKPCLACGAPERSLNRPYCPPCNVKVVREWQKAHPEMRRRWRLKKLYKLTQEDYDAMMKSQDGLCANVDCGRPAEVVDHDHKTGRVRGLLCGPCNRALGMMYDNTARIEGLAAYLRRK